MELSLQFGFAPRRWANTLQTIFPKDPGIPKVYRLRVIQLFEAAYNFILQVIWGRRLVWNAQKHNIYIPAQRAQPGYLGIATALNKVLSSNVI